MPISILQLLTTASFIAAQATSDADARMHGEYDVVETSGARCVVEARGSVWEPTPPADEYHVLGHVISEHGCDRPPQHQLVVARSRNKSLAPPVEFVWRWEVVRGKFTVWTMKCPDGYVSLGAIATNSTTSKPLRRDYRCVAEHLTVAAAGFGRLIYYGNGNNLFGIKSRADTWQNPFFTVTYGSRYSALYTFPFRPQDASKYLLETSSPVPTTVDTVPSIDKSINNLPADTYAVVSMNGSALNSEQETDDATINNAGAGEGTMMIVLAVLISVIGTVIILVISLARCRINKSKRDNNNTWQTTDTTTLHTQQYTAAVASSSGHLPSDELVWIANNTPPPPPPEAHASNTPQHVYDCIERRPENSRTELLVKDNVLYEPCVTTPVVACHGAPLHNGDKPRGRQNWNYYEIPDVPARNGAENVAARGDTFTKSSRTQSDLTTPMRV